MTYWRTWRIKSEGGGQATHLDGIADSYTLCGLDTAGDSMVHGRDPQELKHKPRITCKHCQQIIEVAKEHLKKTP